MCGITGFWNINARPTDLEAIEAMADALTHRGPDARGVFTDAEAGLAMGHRRLSIIDLSEHGAQPMKSACGRFVVVYNGEIYNFRQLRRQLRSRRPDLTFRGDSDTEVLLEAIATFGVDDAVEKTNGMFAFALWDRRRRQLTLGRDRLGIKPLYYGRVGSALMFGSELKSLRAHPRFDADVDRQALADLLRLNSIPAPRSIYQGIKKLEPGMLVSFDAPDRRGRLRDYWSARAAAEQGISTRFRGTPAEAVDALEQRLVEAVEARMISDVPLGAFLSGGVDSSTVVALMQQISARPVKTFSIGFHNDDYNEATHAAEVAAHLGTDHTEQYVTPDDAMEVIPELPRLYDEPFADSSQIPTHLVSQIARRDVTVALSGDGGDELFAGYNRHLWAPRIWRMVSPVPAMVRLAVANLLTRPDPAQVNAMYHRVEAALPRPLRVRVPAEKLQKLAGMLAVSGIDDIYARLRAHWPDPTAVIQRLPRYRPTVHRVPQRAGFAERMMFRDLVGYLPDDILTKVDRASMGVSLEARVPLLDHRVVEFAWRLPMEFKIRDGQSKWVLRQLLYRRVPRQLIERPKMGFGIPLGDWFRTSLRDWVEALLDPHRLRREGFFRVQPIRRMWNEHLEGQANHQHELWNVLAFQAWWQQHK